MCPLLSALLTWLMYAALLAWVWLLAASGGVAARAAIGPLAGARGVRALPAVGMWLLPQPAGLALLRLEVPLPTASRARPPRTLRRARDTGDAHRPCRRPRRAVDLGEAYRPRLAVACLSRHSYAGRSAR